MSAKHTVWYSAEDDGSRYSCKTSWEVEAYLCDIPGLIEIDSTRYHAWIVEDCANDYYSDHDGGESLWPLKFTLFASKDGPALGVFDVELEYEPQFSASKVKP